MEKVRGEIEKIVFGYLNLSERAQDPSELIDKITTLKANKESVAKLQLQRGVITTDCARQINENLKGLSSSDERLQLLEIMSDDICIHCGDVNKGRCHCMNDER